MRGSWRRNCSADTKKARNSGTGPADSTSCSRPTANDTSGGVRAVQYALRHRPAIGFAFALKDRPDLLIESLVLDSKWADFFSKEDREIAQRRLMMIQSARLDRTEF